MLRSKVLKQLAKGIDQLMDEGVAQLFTSSLNGRKIIGTVGALQFEVIQYRLEHEYNLLLFTFLKFRREREPDVLEVFLCQRELFSAKKVLNSSSE